MPRPARQLSVPNTAESVPDTAGVCLTQLMVCLTQVDGHVGVRGEGHASQAAPAHQPLRGV